ncbi:DUF3085 domain-containing protein [Pseudomonas syringae]|uniref:DUF3085 domain-containing protein n=1 Tax=Pseudomonas syringae TaxID=317 RepID=UPI0009B554E0
MRWPRPNKRQALIAYAVDCNPDVEPLDNCWELARVELGGEFFDPNEGMLTRILNSTDDLELSVTYMKCPCTDWHQLTRSTASVDTKSLRLSKAPLLWLRLTREPAISYWSWRTFARSVTLRPCLRT